MTWHTCFVKGQPTGLVHEREMAIIQGIAQEVEEILRLQSRTCPAG